MISPPPPSSTRVPLLAAVTAHILITDLRLAILTLTIDTDEYTIFGGATYINNMENGDITINTLFQLICHARWGTAKVGLSKNRISTSTISYQHVLILTRQPITAQY